MDATAIIARVSFARSLESHVIEALAATSHTREIERGTMITMEGEPAEAMYLVIDGRIKVVRHAPNGREQILHVVEPVGHFNTVPMLDGGVCPATTEALLPSVLLVLPRLGLQDCLGRYPTLGQALLAEFASRMRMLVGLVEDLALHTVHGRLARLLLMQAQAAADGNPTPPLTQTEIASHIGTVREMVGRALKSFEVAGLIRLERGAISIIDAERLAEQADF